MSIPTKGVNLSPDHKNPNSWFLFCKQDILTTFLNYNLPKLNLAGINVVAKWFCQRVGLMSLDVSFKTTLRHHLHIRPVLHMCQGQFSHPKSSIPIGAKVEISPKGFTLGVKADIEKSFSICPKLVINAEHYGLVLAPRQKKGYHKIWEANLQPLGPMFQHLSQSWCQCSSIH